jgi:hypothetical protein
MRGFLFIVFKGSRSPSNLIESTLLRLALVANARLKRRFTAKTCVESQIGLS